MIPSNLPIQLLAAGGTTDINLSLAYDEYYLWSSGTITLVGNQVIATTSTPVDGDTVIIKYSARQLLNGSTFTVFGQNIDQEAAMNNLHILCRYDGTAAAWKVIVCEDFSGIPIGNIGVETTAITNAGIAETLVAGIDEKVQRYTSAAALAMAANVTVTQGGTPTEGDEFTIIWDATLVIGAFSVVLFGQTLTNLQALSGKVLVHTIYNGAAWVTTVWDRYHVDKFRLMCDSTDTVPDWLDGKVQNSIVADAATHKIKLDGDATAPGNSYYYGTDSAGAKGFYPIGSNILLYTDLQIAHADILTLNTVPIEIVGNPGAGLAIEVVSCSMSIKGTAGVVTPYITNTTVRLITDTATQPQVYTDRILTSTVDRTINQLTANMGAVTTDTQIIANKKLYVDVQTANPGGGAAGAILTIHLMYRIITIV